MTSWLLPEPLLYMHTRLYITCHQIFATALAITLVVKFHKNTAFAWPIRSHDPFQPGSTHIHLQGK